RDGYYSVTVTTECKIFEDDISVIYLPPIEYELGDDTYLCDNQLFLDAATTGYALYRWQDGSDLPFYVIDKPGTYSVSVFNQCEEVVQEIEVFECEHCDVYWPNVFSPDFDGVNDRFFPQSDCPLDNFQLQIFDRWGALVFSSKDPSDGWDGTYQGEKANMGTYIWWSRFTVIENELPRTVEASGGITVIR
ncbi:MAG: gliding motility-associated C-terminal domain-containing protein, partial [Phaeodactylibacter sp.]|nr:gliding motility-associated C-terminal domain-containing protein [Phaeodactylibacter sp.]